MQDPKAIEAVRQEGLALVAEDTWLENTVVERDELREQAKANGETIHLGELMSICSIKFF